jgi:hypothetical protein
MDDAQRPCTECDTLVTPPRITCSPRCRAARSRRIRSRRLSSDEAQLDRTDAPRLAQDILRDELTPIVREAITEEVLEGIQNLIGHIPDAINAAAADLEAEDDVTRQKAYTLILKHGLGPNLVPSINDDRQQELNVYFGIPRPPVAAQPPASALPVRDPEAPPIEARQCDTCREFKAPEDFVGSSDRCHECFEGIRKTATDALGEDALDGPDRGTV